MNELSKKSPEEIAIIEKELHKIYQEKEVQLQVGDTVYCSHYGVGKIVSMGVEKHTFHGKEYESFEIRVVYKNKEYSKEYPTSKLDTEYLNKSTFKIENPESFEADSLALSRGDITGDQLIARDFPESNSQSDSTELMIMNKDLLINTKNALMIKKNFLQARSQAAQQLLEKKRWELLKIADHFNAIIRKLNRLIYTIELYLGVNEQLHHIQQGTYGKGPICFRQRRLYMDIEVGDPTDEGLDFRNIEAFDEWLLKFNAYWKMKNYEIMLPEQKGIVIFKVRKESKNYSENPFINHMMNEANHFTYILIRNGENIYRIWADIVIGDKLFPNQEELASIAEAASKEKDRRNRDENELESKFERYKLNMILMQGLIERTPCFPEEQMTVSLFKQPIPEEAIKFIYDADYSKMLPHGIPTFKEWWASMMGFEVGDRVFLLGRELNYSEGKRSQRRFLKYYAHDSSIPDNPHSGVYLVEQYKEIQNEWQIKRGDPIRTEKIIKYDPGKRWWSEDNEGKRTMRTSFIVYPDDSFIINWDRISRKDLKLLEFYSHTRIGREAYLFNIPAIMGIVKEKQKEMASEDDFIRLVLEDSGFDPEKDFELGVDMVDWWKTKNKWKRWLKTDDFKAYRMISKRLTNYKNGKQLD